MGYRGVHHQQTLTRLLQAEIPGLVGAPSELDGSQHWLLICGRIQGAIGIGTQHRHVLAHRRVSSGDSSKLVALLQRRGHAHAVLGFDGPLAQPYRHVRSLGLPPRLRPRPNPLGPGVPGPHNGLDGPAQSHGTKVADVWEVQGRLRGLALARRLGSPSHSRQIHRLFWAPEFPKLVHIPPLHVQRGLLVRRRLQGIEHQTCQRATKRNDFNRGEYYMVLFLGASRRNSSNVVQTRQPGYVVISTPQTLLPCVLPVGDRQILLLLGIPSFLVLLGVGVFSEENRLCAVINIFFRPQQRSNLLVDELLGKVVLVSPKHRTAPPPVAHVAEAKPAPPQCRWRQPQLQLHQIAAVNQLRFPQCSRHNLLCLRRELAQAAKLGERSLLSDSVGGVEQARQQQFGQPVSHHLSAELC
mmetsp:Transcript_16356/g.36102  ORF Transcript_16356/g.36102 Transcript_16356/m.36102 type:complete len:412 (-) Transcript_16356:1131-2366(-)